VFIINCDKVSLKIGILSDTHLGASSIDPELRMDSFDAFEEGLKTLVGAGADVILHSGDFYDRTDPQPWIHDKATTILRSTITGVRGGKSIPPRTSDGVQRHD